MMGVLLLALPALGMRGVQRPGATCGHLSRRALVGQAASTLLLVPMAAEGRIPKKDTTAPKCYDGKFNEVPCQTTMTTELKTSTSDMPESWREGLGAPVANPSMVTVTSDGQEAAPGSGNANQRLRSYIPDDSQGGQEPSPTGSSAVAPVATRGASAKMDVNNMVAVEFSTYPGLYPTIGGKLVKRGPFTSKQQAYGALDTDSERAALKQYDKLLVFNKRDDDLLQYKNAGFYFKGKGGDTKRSSEFRDEEIKRLQSERKQ